jgi:hypothetical protein
LKTSVAEIGGLPSAGSEANMCFSPDEQLVLVGRYRIYLFLFLDIDLLNV